MAELRGGCGSINSWDGVWPKFLIWFSIAWSENQKKNINYYFKTQINDIEVFTPTATDKFIQHSC